MLGCIDNTDGRCVSGIQLATGELMIPLYYSGGQRTLGQGLCISRDHGCAKAPAELSIPCL